MNGVLGLGAMNHDESKLIKCVGVIQICEFFGYSCSLAFFIGHVTSTKPTKGSWKSPCSAIDKAQQKLAELILPDDHFSCF